MTQTKKLVCGTKLALDTAIATHKAKGWTLDLEATAMRRGLYSPKLTYVAYLSKPDNPEKGEQP